ASSPQTNLLRVEAYGIPSRLAITKSIDPLGPLRGPEQLRDVPRPDLVGSRGQQFRLGIDGVAQLVAPFAPAALGPQNPVHRRDRTQGDAFVQQPCPDLARRRVDESVARERPDDLGALLGPERPRRWGALLGRG